jgi:hypothetical protein
LPGGARTAAPAAAASPAADTAEPGAPPPGADAAAADAGPAAEAGAAEAGQVADAAIADVVTDPAAGGGTDSEPAPDDPADTTKAPAENEGVAPAAEPASPADGPTTATAAGEPAPGLAGGTPEQPEIVPPAAASPVDIESVAARRLAARRRVKPPPRPWWRGRGAAAAIVAFAFLDIGLIIGRADIVRVLPQTASLYEAIGLPVNLRDLAFEGVRTTQEVHDGVQILVVEGTIRAIGRHDIDVPRLRFSIAAANGHEIYAWTAVPTRTTLAPGETMPFRTRLASPPEQGRTIRIRFFHRLDRTSGLR